MPSIIKSFLKPSVDNPALLAVFVRSLTDQYRQAFPASRGFMVESEERKVRNSTWWVIRILHGHFGGMAIQLAPGLSFAHEIRITSATISRFEMFLQKAAAVLALLLLLPFGLVALFVLHRLGFVLLLGAPVHFVLAAVLVGIGTGIARLFSKFDHHFDEHTTKFALALADRLPLPHSLQPSDAASAAQPVSQPLNAMPQRTGMWPWRGLHDA